MLIECSCGNKKSYSVECQCPNDVIDETGYIQDDLGNWICPEC